MSKTTRHRDFWRLRQIRKAAVHPHGYGSPVRQDPEFMALWSKYGTKGRVFDKRRRVSTRKSNSEYVRELRRAARRAARQRVKVEAASMDLDASLWPVRPSRR